ncbi:glycoside hydrolase family 28 protein [Persicobacter diffluens]|uniref:Glycoside hydrolase n=1 Tax=Persicobacter diffluens TaxID=981 RepID=A0AAN4W2W7_9BACT|nr:glycoside hydrolase [Persicobacter diffluens]
MKKISFLFCISLLYLGSCQRVQEEDPFVKGVANVMEKIAPPKIEGPSILLTEFSGQLPDANGTYDFRSDIQAAIDSLSAMGGGHLIFNNTLGSESWIKWTEVYRCKGPINLKSNVALGFDPSTVLHFEFAPEAYLGEDGKGVLRRYEGTMMYSFSPLIYGFNIENVKLYSTSKNGASPIITGDGELWLEWQQVGRKSRIDRGLLPSNMLLKKVNVDGVPVADRVFNDVKEDFYRPQLFSLYFSKNILVDGIKFQDSPFWMINPVFCQNLTFQNLILDGKIVNNDGIDPDGCEGVLIQNVLFDTHDDNIAIKSGRDREAREGVAVEGTEMAKLNSPFIRDGLVGNNKTKHVFIRNCHFKNHYAICIGSEIGAGAQHIYALDNYALQDVKMGVFLKSNRTRGGVIEDVYVRNFKINEIGKDAICIISNYDNDSTSPYPTMFKNISIENMEVNHSATGVRIYGWADAVLENIKLKNIHIQSTDSNKPVLEYNFVRDLSLENVSIGNQQFDYKESRIVKGENAPQQL